MSNKRNEMPKEDRDFYIALGWLSAASVSIASLLTLG